MLRETVVQGLLDFHPSPSYLEVGVHSGFTFHGVTAARKVAVDPVFQFAVPEPAITPALEYHAVPSDDYFGSIVQPGTRFQVIYLDGLHTLEQTLRDLLNAVEHLADDGVIVIDDVVPSSWAASLPDMADFAFVREQIPVESEGIGWMGDVYRLVFFVQTFMQSFSYAVVADNHGQLVMWRAPRAAVPHPERTVEWVGRIDILAMHRNIADMRRLPYTEILAEYRPAMLARRALAKG